MTSSFKITGGAYTMDEASFMLDQGLKQLNSKGEIYDVSTESETDDEGLTGSDSQVLPDELGSDFPDLSTPDRSNASNNSGSNLDDTLAVMTKLLQLADEQEKEEEKINSETVQKDAPTEVPALKARLTTEQFRPTTATMEEKEIVNSKENEGSMKTTFELRHDTPLPLPAKAQRFGPGKKVYFDLTPFPAKMNSKTILSGKIPNLNPKYEAKNALSSCTGETQRKKLLTLSTPPTPVKLIRTTKAVLAKIDSGLPKSPFPNAVIFSNPAPSPFARFRGIQKVASHKKPPLRVSSQNSNSMAIKTSLACPSENLTACKGVLHSPKPKTLKAPPSSQKNQENSIPSPRKSAVVNGKQFKCVNFAGTPAPQKRVVTPFRAGYFAERHR